MDDKNDVARMAALLRKLRQERRISLRQLANEAGVGPATAWRAEHGKDAALSTWEKLFSGLGYRLIWGYMELAEEAGDRLSEEAAARRERRHEGLCAGKWRF